LVSTTREFRYPIVEPTRFSSLQSPKFAAWLLQLRKFG
jgi:hypothetical protein